MENIRVRLQRGDRILGDGAIGTLLMERGLKSGEPSEHFNLNNPQVLENIAASYLEAGSEIISTNTFGASPLALRKHSLDHLTEEINVKAVNAVRKAVGKKAYISGSVGPSGYFIAPFGDTAPDDIYAGYERQIKTLLGAGVDMICIETMSDLTEITLAIKAARSLAQEIPIMATMTFEKKPRGFFTMMGVSVENAAKAVEKAGADIAGSNCGNGIENMIAIAGEFRKHTRLPIAIQSNAGLSVTVEGKVVYPETPEFHAARASELLAIGVQIIGGCCGTRPDHIRALRKVMNSIKE